MTTLLSRWCITATLALAFAAACGAEAERGDGAATVGHDPSASAAPAPSSGAAGTDPGTGPGSLPSGSAPGTRDPGHDGLTWTRDIAPMVGLACGSCHGPDGQGTGDFSDRELVRDFAPAMIQSVQAGRMPPPAADPECRDYHGSERWTAPPDFAARLRAWVEDGAPEGDPADAVEIPPMETALEDADLEILLPAPYVPQFDGTGNEYRCFVLEHGRDETFHITGYAPIIDRPELVHHILLFKERRDDLSPAQRGDDGYRCPGMNIMPDLQPDGHSTGLVGGWAPGGPPIRFAEGAGIRMEPDDVLVMQIHYFDSGAGPPAADRSGYTFTTAASASETLIMVPFGPMGFRIPAGAEAHVAEGSTVLGQPFRIHGMFPHMHVLGWAYDIWAGDDENDICLARADRYSFDHQLVYMYPEPVDIPAHTPVHVRCTWNNSESNPNRIIDPPADVGFGTGTQDEMCFGFALVSFD
ncbi:MAG: hypothetical protein EA398_17940 [Deltaproteobacteria bacterium]|nr:MAG: hypothetical protein EA398_17940 [Deltaproteobacteria bacterium]